jgi:hypothetical protein
MAVPAVEAALRLVPVVFRVAFGPPSFFPKLIGEDRDVTNPACLFRRCPGPILQYIHRCI